MSRSIGTHRGAGRGRGNAPAGGGEGHRRGRREGGEHVSPRQMASSSASSRTPAPPPPPPTRTTTTTTTTTTSSAAAGHARHGAQAAAGAQRRARRRPRRRVASGRDRRCPSTPGGARLSAVRVEIDRTRAEMAAALGEVSAAAKDGDDALEEGARGAQRAPAERIVYFSRILWEETQAESTSRGSGGRRGSSHAGSRPRGDQRVSLADAERFESLRVETRARRVNRADARGRRRRRTPCGREIRTVKSSSSWRAPARGGAETTRGRGRGDGARAARAEEARRVAEGRRQTKSKAKSKNQKSKTKPAFGPGGARRGRQPPIGLRDGVATRSRGARRDGRVGVGGARGKGALAAVKADLEQEDEATVVDAVRRPAELARLDGETRADVVNAAVRSPLRELEWMRRRLRRRRRDGRSGDGRGGGFDASAGVVAEKEALVAEVNARARELADERAEGEHRRGSHNMKMEELQRQLCADAGPRGGARQVSDRGTGWGTSCERRGWGGRVRVSGGRRRRGRARDRRRRRDETRNGRIAIDGGWVRPRVRAPRRAADAFAVYVDRVVSPRRSRRRRRLAIVVVVRRYPKGGARPRRRDAFVRAPARVVADPGPAPAAPAPSGSAFAADVGVEFVRLVAIEFESIKRVVSREGRSRVGERAGERARGRRRAARGVVLDVLLRRASSRLGLFDWVCLTRHGEALRFTKLIRYKFSYPARRVSRLDTRAPRPPSRRERTPPTKRLPSSTRSRRVVTAVTAVTDELRRSPWRAGRGSHPRRSCAQGAHAATSTMVKPAGSREPTTGRSASVMV